MTAIPNEVAISAICNIFGGVNQFLWILAGGIGTIVITLQGIKWIGSAEDKDARKQAKMGIIHAMIGLIIVVLAVWIVQLVLPVSCGFNT